MNLILGYENDDFGLAYKKYFYKLFEKAIKAIKALANGGIVQNIA